MNRNHGLDLTKTICAFMIICIHMPFPGVIGKIVTPLTRIAVPLFFMITGYYYSVTCERKNVKKQLNRVLSLFIGANLLYFIWVLLNSSASNNSLPVTISEMFKLKAMLRFVLLNESPFGGHLWYLGAILYVLLIIFVFEKKWERKKLYPIVPVLLVTDLAFGKYSLLLFGQTFPYIFVRNFLCVGLPYFLIGDWIYTHNIRLSSGKARIFIVIFAFTTLAERALLGTFSVNAERDHYISTTFLAVFTFLLAVQHKNPYRNKCLSVLYAIGKKLSASIYILHPIVIALLSKIVAYCSGYLPLAGVLYPYIAPFLIFFVSIIISWLLLKTSKKIKTRMYCFAKK